MKQMKARYDNSSSFHQSTGEVQLFGEVTDGLSASVGRKLSLTIKAADIEHLITTLARWQCADSYSRTKRDMETAAWLRALADKIEGVGR